MPMAPEKPLRLGMLGWLPGPGGVLSEKLGGVVRTTSQNPYSIYDQNLRVLLPYI